jgi:pyrroline-5-carboxylate reductase
MKYEFGFIGCGNMGGAIADAVAKSVAAEKLACADYFKEKTDRLHDTYGFRVEDTVGIARECRFIFLGVKPQMMADTLSSVSEILKARSDRFVLVTMAAGMTADKIAELAGGAYPVIRIMPNTPVSVGEGTVLYTANSEVTDGEIADFKAAMKFAGVLDEIPEKLIDAASAVSGCGPAFVAMMIEALADGGVECGLPRDKALLYAAQTFAGTAKLLLESGKHPGKLKDEVCSPGGTTICGVHEIEKGAVRASLMSAVRAAYEKSTKIGK